MRTAGLLLLFTILALVDVPRIIHHKKVLLVYSVLLLSALTLSELHILRVQMWGLNQIVMKVFQYFVA